MKRLKTAESKNEEQLKAIECQGKKLKAIKNQNKNQLKAILQSKLTDIPGLRSINLMPILLLNKEKKSR